MYSLEDLENDEQSGFYQSQGESLYPFKTAKEIFHSLLPDTQYQNAAKLQIIEAVCLHTQYQPYFLREASRFSGETGLLDAVISYVNSLGFSDFQKRQAFTLLADWCLALNFVSQKVYGEIHIPSSFHLEQPLTLQMVADHFEKKLPVKDKPPGLVIDSICGGTIVLSYSLQEQFIAYIDQLFPDEPTLIERLDAFAKTPNCRVYDLVGFLKKYSLLCRQRFSQDSEPV